MAGKIKAIMIPIVIVYNNKRKELVEQTFSSLERNTIYPYKLFTGEHKGNDFSYLKIKNEIVRNIPYKWDLIVIADDDIYFNKGWLSLMVKEMKKNQDIWAIAGTHWYTKKHLEKRKNITLIDVAGGGVWILRKSTWDKCGPYEIDVRKTYIMAEKIKKNGGKMAFLNDQTKVVHCGITSLIDKKERVKKGKEYIKKLAEVVGAKTL